MKKSDYETSVTYYAERARKGYVRHKEITHMTCRDFLGGFSILYAMSPKTYYDILNGMNGGYIGHGYRRIKHDVIIEKVFKNAIAMRGGKVLKIWDILGEWLTSSDARHWMNTHEDDSPKEFEAAVRADAWVIVLLGLTFADPKHKGDARSTYELRLKWEKGLSLDLDSE